MENDLATRRLLPFDQPTLLIIDLMMLLRMVCTDTAQCSSFGDLADQLQKPGIHQIWGTRTKRSRADARTIVSPKVFETITQHCSK